MSQRDKKRKLTEQLGAWLKGDLRLREERELYRTAQEDPFLQDALQGYDRFPEGNHSNTIAALKGKLKKQKRRGMILPIRIAAAAASILILTASVWWLLQPSQAELASAETTEKMEEQPSTAEEGIAPPMSDEEQMAKESEKKEVLPPVIEQKEVASKPQIQKTEATKPEMAERPKEEISEEMAMDVQPVSPIVLPEEDINPPPPPPAPVREEAVAAGQAAAKKKSDQNNVISRESIPYAPIAKSRRMQAPSAYDLSEQDQLIQRARPVGGFAALENYLDSVWQKPWKADSTLVEEPFIELEFQVLKDGTLSDFRILNSINVEEDSTFIQVLKNGPAWEFVDPNMKQAVKVQYRFPKRNN
jgi:hypothetical protein